MGHSPQRLFPFLAVFACLVLPGGSRDFDDSEAAAAPPASEYEQWLASIEATPEAALAAVRARIAYRPYPHRVKGAQGAFQDRSANARDASELLLAVLQAKKVSARLVRGRLTSEQVKLLIAGVLEGDPPPKEVQDALPEDEAARKRQDAELRRAATAHFWVQVRNGDAWIDLDPIAPEAEAGEAFGSAGKPDERRPPLRMLQIDVRVQGEGGRPLRTVLRFRKPVDELLGTRISYLHEGLAETARSEKPGPEALRPVLVVGDQITRGTPFSGRPAGGAAPGGRLGEIFGTPSKEAPLEAVWMLLSLSGGGLPPRSEKRYLYIAGTGGLDRLDDLTSWCVTFGAPPASSIRSLAESATQCAEDTRELAFSGSSPLSKDEAKKAHRMLCGALDATGAAAFWIADQTHRLLEQLDAAFGTVTDYGDARVIGVSFDARRECISSDLVFDSVACWARPGAKASSVLALHCARGRLAGEVEGATLARLSSKVDESARGVVTTGRVFNAAFEAEIAPVIVSKESKAGLEKLALSGATQRILLERIEEGRVVVIPARPVDLDGGERIAWYEIDRTNGDWIAVAADGRHQGMTMFKKLYEEVAFATGVSITYLVSFSGQMYFFAGSMVRNIEDPKQTYKEVLDGALKASQSTSTEFARIPQAFGDFMGSIGSNRYRIALALIVGQGALQGGIDAAGRFIRRRFY